MVEKILVGILLVSLTYYIYLVVGYNTMIKISSSKYSFDKNLPIFNNEIPSRDMSHIVYYISQTRDKYPSIKNPDMLFDKLLADYIKPNYNLTDCLIDFCRDTINSQNI